VAVITSILCDLGGVLIDFDHLTAVRKISSLTKKSPGEIQGIIFASPAVRSFETGEISAHDFHREVQALLAADIPYDRFLRIWNEIFIFSHENSVVYELLKKLKPRYAIAMLSNTNEPHYSYLKKNYPIFDPFHYLFASHELGMVKPDSRIYSYVLSVMQKVPGEVFYIDDRPEMVKAACALGIRGFVYTCSFQLYKDLDSCGVAAALK